jgi:hypothetical protein
VDRDEPPVVVPVTADPEGDEELIAAGPRLPRWLVLAVIAVAVAGGLTALVLKNDRHPTAAPSPSPTPSVISPAPEGLADLSVQDFAINHAGELYVLTSPPERLVSVDPDRSIRARVRAPVGAKLVVADPPGDLVWVIVPHRGSSDVSIYAGPTMAAVGQLQVSATVVAAAALEDQLFMATDRGIYRGWPGGTATQLQGYTGPVQAIAADPPRFRLLAVSKSYDLIRVGEDTAQKVRKLTSLRAKSIVVTDDDHIWLVGFGQPSGSRIGSLDPQTLDVTLLEPGDPQADRGAIGWTGGSVFWVEYADSASLVCMDGSTGAASGTYSETDTPVVSVPGVIYAVRGTGVVKLPSPTACRG